MENERDIFKLKEDDTMWWSREVGKLGIIEFSFDKENWYYLYRDFPYKLKKDEIDIFVRENPFWADYFKERLEEVGYEYNQD